MNKEMKEKIRSKRVIVLIFVFMLMISTIPLFYNQGNVRAAGTAYYVSKSGSNSYDGKFSTHTSGNHGPKLTIQSAITNNATAGDTIYIETGSYNEMLYINHSGTAGNPITISNYNINGHNDHVTLNGTGVTIPANYALINLINRGSGSTPAKNITFRNINIENSSRIGMRNFAVSVPASNITITNCSFKNIAYGASWFGDDNDVKRACDIYINNCTYYNIMTAQAWPVTANGDGECVSFEYCNNLRFEHNTMSKCYQIMLVFNACNHVEANNNSFEDSYIHINDTAGPGDYCFYVGNSETGSISSSYVNCTHNIIYGLGQGFGLGCESGGTATIINHVNISNNIIRTTGGGNNPFVWTNNSGGSVWNAKNITVKYNTFYCGGTVSVMSIQLLTSVQNCVIANNIFVSADGSTYAITASKYASTTFTRANNTYYKVGGTAHCNWASGSEFETTYRTGNPLFKSIATYDFHINATSNCKNNASLTYKVSTDYNNVARDSKPDIGAYEYISSTMDKQSANIQ